MPDRTPDDASRDESLASEGFPSFSHSQWSIEGEIERFQAFGVAGARARGWQRVVAVVMVLLLVLPGVLALVTVVYRWIA